MQRKFFLAVLAVLTMLGGCAPRDPNLAVRGMNEFSRSAGDYTLSVKVYGLDDKGQPRLVSEGDASMQGFVTRALAPKGYVLKTGGPARYNLEVHLLCGNTRQADMGIMAEELYLPAEAVGTGYAKQMHYWLPDTARSTASTHELRDSMQTRGGSGSERKTQNALGGSPLGRTTPDFCQGRVLVVLSAQGAGSQREAFVGRAGTGDCQTVAGCPLSACGGALDQALVELLERRL